MITIRYELPKLAPPGQLAYDLRQRSASREPHHLPMATRFFDFTPNSENAADRPPRYALVVGNSAYPRSRLKNAGADATLVAEALRSIGFDADVLVDADKRAIEDSVVAFGLKLRRGGEAAVGIFYFAGHGTQQDGQNYLIPIDAQVSDRAYLKSAAVSIHFLVDELAKAPDAAKVVILDACRNDPLPDAANPTRDLRQGLASVRDVPDGTLIVFSTAADTVAFDGGGRNGPYAEALAKALTKPGRLLHEVMFDVSRQVIEATRGRQRPALFIQGAMPSVRLVEDGPVGVVERTDTGRITSPVPIPPQRTYPKALLAACGLVAISSVALAIWWIESSKRGKLEEPKKPGIAQPTGQTGGNSGRVARTFGRMRTAADPARLALPRKILEVADRYDLSTEVSQLIFLQKSLSFIAAGRHAETLAELRSLAETGQPVAQVHLAVLLYEGRPGIPVNKAEALRWARESAEQGQSWGQVMAGDILIDSGVASDRGLGTLWLNLAAMSGDPSAKETLAKRGIPKLPGALDLDVPMAAFDAGDRAKALQELRIFLEHRNGMALYLAGRIFYEGGGGVAADPERGVELVRESARQQFGDAMEILASAYADGRGIKRNNVESLAWWRLAFENARSPHKETLVPSIIEARKKLRAQEITELGTILPAIAGEVASQGKQ